MKKILPAKGHVGIICLTDKQFGMMEVFHGPQAVATPETAQQLEMF